MKESLDRIFREQKTRVLESGLAASPTRISLQLLYKVLPMAIRGAIRKPWLRNNVGLPLIGRNVRMSNSQLISIGSGFIVEDGAEIQGLASDGLVFGDNVSVGSNARIRPSSYYSREIGRGLVMGDRSSIGPDCYVGCSGGIRIGNNVMLGPAVRLFSENHEMEDSSVPIKDKGVDWKPIIIEDDCWIASGAVITAGVTIGKGSVVAAGAVVTKDVPAQTLVAGIPARVIRTLT